MLHIVSRRLRGSAEFRARAVEARKMMIDVARRPATLGSDWARQAAALGFR
jgi:hypothetical protein